MGPFCAVDLTSTWTTSVCTGSLILAAAGLPADRRATTHWLALDQLADPPSAVVQDLLARRQRILTGAPHALPDR